jgi:mRNA interferase RelE/StbE
MFQVNFSEQSMHELNQLETRSQMLLVEVVSSLTQEQLDHPNDELGSFNRNGKTYYRVRAGEFRIYFEQDKDGLFAHYILHKNTLSDFIFRFKMPVSENQAMKQLGNSVAVNVVKAIGAEIVSHLKNYSK